MSCAHGFAWADKAFENEGHALAECSKRGLCDTTTVRRFGLSCPPETDVIASIFFIRVSVTALKALRVVLVREVTKSAWIDTSRSCDVYLICSELSGSVWRSWQMHHNSKSVYVLHAVLHGCVRCVGRRAGHLLRVRPWVHRIGMRNE